MLKINYKFETNNSKKINYFLLSLCRSYKNRQIISVSIRYREVSRPLHLAASHVHNETSVSVHLKHSSYSSTVILLLFAEAKVLRHFGCVWRLHSPKIQLLCAAN